MAGFDSLNSFSIIPMMMEWKKQTRMFQSLMGLWRMTSEPYSPEKRKWGLVSVKEALNKQLQ